MGGLHSATVVSPEMSSEGPEFLLVWAICREVRTELITSVKTTE